MKNKFFITILFFYFIFLPFYAFSEEYEIDNVSDFVIIKSSYATIYIHPSIDLTKLVDAVDVGFARYDPVESGLFMNRGITKEEVLANKLDIITRKAQNILDMRPRAFHVNLKIYPTEEDLAEVYKDLFREERYHKAFYIHALKTIFISQNNMSVEILAHEIAHSVIDNYFDILPPLKIRELLACYVDIHIRD